MKMTEEVFQECLTAWEVSTGNKSFWGELAQMHGYKSAESLRSAFKRERQARGIKKIQNRTIQQMPVVGVMDLETLPLAIRGFLFGIRDQYITYDMVEKDSHMLSWAGKLLGDNRIFSDIMTPEEAVNYDSYRVTQSAMEFVNACDFIIGHNWNGFDGKVLNSELMFNNLPPVAYRAIDTLSLLRSNFREASYKLSDINKKYGIRDKLSNEGKALWVKCAAGDAKALATMLEYNEGDILATEELFWRIEPYVSNSLPDLSVFTANNVRSCFCGSTLLKRDGYWTTNTAKYERFRCQECDAIYRGKKNLLSKEKRATLLTGV